MCISSRAGMYTIWPGLSSGMLGVAARPLLSSCLDGLGLRRTSSSGSVRADTHARSSESSCGGEGTREGQRANT